MGQNQDSQSENEFLQSFSKFLLEDEPESIDDMKAALAAQGVDVRRLLERANETFQRELRARREQRKLLATQQRAEFLKSFDETIVSIPKTVEGLKELINQFISGAHGHAMQQAALAQFRKYEKTTEADLRLLAQDLLKLKALDKESEK